jgi:hypothetical protein
MPVTTIAILIITSTGAAAAATPAAVVTRALPAAAVCIPAPGLAAATVAGAAGIVLILTRWRVRIAGPCCGASLAIPTSLDAVAAGTAAHI